ncbi:transcriptional regulator [Sporosarcina sp. P16b]|uniref:helix-turn-helix domain-containing protein n=1 Tax=Sporosarcina sp. P16b TaxID=2048261 RepID=UPI000C16471F|nr:helix-turn-helix transcriptional regulator [Sporosarcina sp. P16b]PIC71148.1 transcriptional regulator [Sporosarcina sp. P16b]
MVEVTIRKSDIVKLKIATKGYGIRSFSGKIGISHSYLSQILNEHKKPSATVASKIAKGLDEEVLDLFLIKVVDDLPNEATAVL